MTVSSLLLGAGLVLLTAYFVTRPFYDATASALTGRAKNERLRLLERRVTLYAAIREIDADVQVGKLEPEDHRILRRRYVAEGVAVLKALDALPRDERLDRAIEADLARLGEGALPGPLGPAFCPNCGATTGADDRFCAKCGARVGG